MAPTEVFAEHVSKKRSLSDEKGYCSRLKAQARLSCKPSEYPEPLQDEELKLVVANAKYVPQVSLLNKNNWQPGPLVFDQNKIEAALRTGGVEFLKMKKVTSLEHGVIYFKAPEPQKIVLAPSARSSQCPVA